MTAQKYKTSGMMTDALSNSSTRDADDEFIAEFGALLLLLLLDADTIASTGPGCVSPLISPLPVLCAIMRLSSMRFAQ